MFDDMFRNRDRRRFTLVFAVLVVVVGVAGLLAGFACVRSLGTPVAEGTPTAFLTTAPATVPATMEATQPATSPPEVSPTLPPTATSLPPTSTPRPFLEGPFSYGTSFGGRSLEAYRLGSGPSVRAIIGGIHGGYEWNTVVLVSETLQYLQQNPGLVPDEVTLYVIPCANPDGYATGHGLEGRVNGNGVDLNRNWNYEWQPTATHGTRPVDAGSSPFSEPETAALRDLILEREIEAAIFYHSALAKIFYGVETEISASDELAQVVSEATGYPTAAGIPGQITTGDAVDWMSAQGLAGIEVELTDHQNIEWERNLRGLQAFLNWSVPARPAATSFIQTTQIGNSVEGRPLQVTQIGDGAGGALVVIGGIHGSEANTEALVRGLMETYAGAPGLVPPEFRLYFLPAMNPDGLAAGTRQNARNADLNRNWPTEDWQRDAARSSGIVPGSGGSAPGSEPEVQAVAHWLTGTVQAGAQQVWLLSYHSAYPPHGVVQPGYSTYGTPGPQADELARLVADLSGHTYVATWPSEHRFSGELIHWSDLHGIWAADVELPNYDPPDTVPGGQSETMLATHRRVLSGLLSSLLPTTAPLPGGDGYLRYTVRPGDTLQGIALQFDVEMEEIMHLNDIEDENRIVEGEELLIPVPASEGP